MSFTFKSILAAASVAGAIALGPITSNAEDAQTGPRDTPVNSSGDNGKAASEERGNETQGVGPQHRPDGILTKTTTKTPSTDATAAQKDSRERTSGESVPPADTVQRKERSETDSKTRPLSDTDDWKRSSDSKRDEASGDRRPHRQDEMTREEAPGNASQKDRAAQNRQNSSPKLPVESEAATPQGGATDDVHSRRAGDNEPPISPSKGTQETPIKPVVINPVPAASQEAPVAPSKSPAEAKRDFDNLRNARRQRTIDGGKGVVIEEPGNRRIIKEDNRVVIQHDETERLKRVAPTARVEKGTGGTSVSVIDRPGNIKIYTETDANGQLLRRYRRGPDGRDVIIIDNRKRRDGIGKNIAKGVGIGLGIAAGAAIVDSVVNVPPPRVIIPRDKYIVEYNRASDGDLYEALNAPPVDNFRDRYTLDEVRYSVRLRDRMRRVDLDDITFDFGAWDVSPSQYGKLDRIARAMRRIVDHDPNEVFLIEGYTDAIGSAEDNLSLSDRRAESVAVVLTQRFSVPFENLTTQGYGKEFLKIPTLAAERLNRRVAVRRITPLLASDMSSNYRRRWQRPHPRSDYDRPPPRY